MHQSKGANSVGRRARGAGARQEGKKGGAGEQSQGERERAGKGMAKETETLRVVVRLRLCTGPGDPHGIYEPEGAGWAKGICLPDAF